LGTGQIERAAVPLGSQATARTFDVSSSAAMVFALCFVHCMYTVHTL
jgi:hypothetical protein